jgi:hypothetical protein
MSQTGPRAAWRKSSFCDNADCVEVAMDLTGVAVRDTTRPDVHLVFDQSSWRELLRDVRAGHLTR